jgi:hypothetical protein
LSNSIAHFALELFPPRERVWWSLLWRAALGLCGRAAATAACGRAVLRQRSLHRPVRSAILLLTSPPSIAHNHRPRLRPRSSLLRCRCRPPSDRTETSVGKGWRLHDRWLRSCDQRSSGSSKMDHWAHLGAGHWRLGLALIWSNPFDPDDPAMQADLPSPRAGTGPGFRCCTSAPAEARLLISNRQKFGRMRASSQLRLEIAVWREKRKTPVASHGGLATGGKLGFALAS